MVPGCFDSAHGLRVQVRVVYRFSELAGRDIGVLLCAAAPVDGRELDFRGRIVDGEEVPVNDWN